MPLSPDLDSCDLKIPDSDQRSLSMSPSLTLAALLVDGLYTVIQILGFAFLCVLLLAFFLFGEDTFRILQILTPLVIFYMIFRLGVSIGFRSKRSYLLFRFQQLFQRCLSTAAEEMQVCLTSQQLVLTVEDMQDTREIRQTFLWDQVVAVIEEQSDFQLQLPCLPELRLPKEQLPPEWLEALENFQEPQTDES
ncbi:hypothetical protein Pan153_56850 [Gimesia panareensis]|uniref:YcxB-like protein domain-containing protein n=1 Tax=Gimesia panareensis TaxID=2527978 RepID=A0A518FX93_9PLAN|nr:hypothetical protein [Gimesia panareensis]QDV21003.1 hypothetical protein Pan153_56850 [Gimesia panareensis]